MTNSIHAISAFLRKIGQLIIHPAFIYSCIFVLECIPYDKPLKEQREVYEMPKIGDNFSTVKEEAVYYYSGKGKYSYPDPECYFSFGYPSVDTEYSDGGVKIIAQEIADKIPMLGSMCDQKEQKVAVVENERNTVINKATSTNYLLDHFSEVSHFLAYFALAFSILYHRRHRFTSYGLVFGLCFCGGALLEVVQHFFVLGRKAELDDQLLNSIGALSGLVFYWTLRKTEWIRDGGNKKPDYR